MTRTLSKNYHEFGDEKFYVDKPYKTLVWEEVRISKRDGNIHHIYWRYKPDTINCMKCGKDDQMVYFIQNQNNDFVTSVVVARCLRGVQDKNNSGACNITFIVPCYDGETNKNIAKKLKDEVITYDEAEIICKRLGVTPPRVESEPDDESKPIKDDLTLDDITKGTYSL